MAQAEPYQSRAEEALERLPQRRPASLYDVAVQYSILDWYQTITSGEITFDLAPEHLAFLTPLAKPDLYDEPDNALVVYVDLSNPEEPKFREEEPVKLEQVDRSLRFKLGHAYPENKTSAMTDYSITTHKEATEHHLSGQRADAWGTNNIKDRFTGWAKSEAADEVLEREEVEDKWILEALQQLGEEEERFDELVHRPDFPLDPSDDETEHEVFVTVRVKLPDEEEFKWPGEIPVLNEVMVEQKAGRFENMSVENAGGQGVGYVTSEEGRVTGGSAGLLGMYGKKQREHFPDLSSDGSAAWRSRPVTRETAAALATASSLFGEFYQGLGESRRLYILPYLGSHPEEITPEEFEEFASDVFQRLRKAEMEDFESVVNAVFFEREEEDGEEIEPLFDSLETASPYAHVRVATAFTVSGNPDRVFFEVTNTDPYRPLALREAHERIIEESPLAGEGVFADLVDNSHSPLLARDAEALRTMSLFGDYFQWTTEPTRSSQESQDTPKAGDIDDVRSRRLRQFLTNEKIPVTPLLEEYLHRIIQRQRDRFGQSDRSGVPAGSIVEQYLQLRSLSAIDALATDEQKQPVATTLEAPTSDIATVTQSEQETTYDSQATRLEAFIENHAVLSENKSSEAVFLLGGIVGLVSNFQRRQDISSTLVRRYPVDYLTKQSVKEVTNEVLQMANTYAEEEDYFPAKQSNEYMRRLPDLMLDADPGEWKFPQSELQWLYALGIAYGSNDSPIDTED